MNDIVKIRVLMIYYNHWGIEELKARRAVDGINKTLHLLEDRFQTEEYTMREGLKRMFYYLSSENTSFLWTEFVDILLQNCGGCFDPLQPHDLYDEDEMLFDRKIMLEDNLDIWSEESGDIIYDQDFNYQNVLSVDAIVALF